MPYELRRGLGSVDYDTWMTVCKGSPYSSCAPADQLCTANWRNLVVACDAKRSANPTSNPSQMLFGSADYLYWLGQGGGSIQFLEPDLLTEQGVPQSEQASYIPQGYYDQPGANVAGSASPAATAYAPKLSFATSSGNATSPKVGDSWGIAITGAKPNAPVTATANGSSSNMGSTDGSGNFSKTGSFGAGDVGSWQESWYAGGTLAGSIAFNVQAVTVSSSAAQASSSSTTPAGSSIVNSSGVPVTQQATDTTGTTTTGFDFSAIPWWAWAGAAAIGLFAFAGKH